MFIVRPSQFSCSTTIRPLFPFDNFGLVKVTVVQKIENINVNMMTPKIIIDFFNPVLVFSNISTILGFKIK